MPPIRRALFAFIFLALLPSPGRGEAAQSPYRWTIGYESYRKYSSGPILRRFLGENWEVFLSGGPDDWRVSNTDQDWDEYYRDGSALDLDTDENEGAHKREEGWVMVGGGRRIANEGPFWLTALVGLEYSWRNYQYDDFWEYHEDAAPPSTWSLKTRENTRVGHRQDLAIILGLRPAYDVTSRITLAMYIGLSFVKGWGTEDVHDRTRYYDEDGGLIAFADTHDRTTREYTGFETFGVTGTNYISFIFRF